MEQSGRKTSCGSVEVEMMVHFCRSISGKEAIVAKRKDHRLRYLVSWGKPFNLSKTQTPDL